MTTRAPRPRVVASAPFRRTRRVIDLLLPVAAFFVVIAVLRGAGVPLSVPGIVIVLALLFAARLAMGWSRRRRRDHPVRPLRRPR